MKRLNDRTLRYVAKLQAEIEELNLVIEGYKSYVSKLEEKIEELQSDLGLPK